MTLYKRLSAWLSRRKYLVLSFVVLLISLTLTAHATLTVSDTGLQGDTNITLDANGTLGIGTASATAITIGQSNLNVSIPGSLTVSSATTTVNNLHVTGSCLGCGLFNGITAINGLSNATTSLVAGANITIATSSPNIITISALGGSGSTTPGGSNTQLQFNSSGGFGASGNLTWLSPALTIGQTGTTTGQLKLAGSTSGTVTVQSSSTAGTWNMTLPTSAGTSGYVLSTDGNGNTSWIAQSGGSTVSIDGLTNSAFNFTASGTGLSVATTSPNTVAYTFTNPGFVTSAITAINGLSNATTSLVAGSNITIATSSPNIITISAAGGSGTSTWSGISNPTGNLSLSMGNFTTTFTTGTSTTNPFLIQDTTGNTSTGTLFQVSTIGTSTALPVKFTAQGTLNGVQMNASGTLAVIGAGNINATQLQGIAVSTSTPTTNQVLTYNGTNWSPAGQLGGGSNYWSATSTGIYYNATGTVEVGTTMPATSPPAGSINFAGKLYQNGSLFNKLTATFLLCAVHAQ